MGLGAAVGTAVLGPMGAIPGAFIQRVLGQKKTDSTVTPVATAQTDLTDAPAVAAKQRAARQMSDGLNSTLATSTRGLEGRAGAGLRGPTRVDEPIITSMTGRDLPAGTNTVDSSRAAADAAAARRAADAAAAAARAAKTPEAARANIAERVNRARNQNYGY